TRNKGSKAMKSGTGHSLRGTLWGFLLVLLLAPPLASLVLNTLTQLVLQGGFPVVLLLVCSILLCFQFGSNATRLVVAFFALCLISSIFGQQGSMNISFWSFVVLICGCVLAYWIREHRIGHKHE